MKGRFLFLLPRVIGLTLIIGLAALILGLVFKLLLGLIVIGVIVFAVVSILHRIRGGRTQDTMTGLPKYGRHKEHYNERSSTRQTIVPVN